MSTGNSLATEMVHVPSSLWWLAPIEVEGLISVGSNSDGGYVLPGSLLRDADVMILITTILSRRDSFPGNTLQTWPPS
jgi:hypothetical protein